MRCWSCWTGSSHYLKQWWILKKYTPGADYNENIIETDKVLLKVTVCSFSAVLSKGIWVNAVLLDFGEPFKIRNFMMTSSNGNIFRVTGPLCGEFTGPRWIPSERPVTRSFDVLFDLRLNKRLNKQSWGWWFETPLRPLWRHCNVLSF